MSELIVVGYADPHRAHEVLVALRKLEKQHLIDLEDAAVVTRSAKGKVRLHQTHDLSAAGAVGGGFWGLLIGTFFMAPLLGAAVGAASGAISGALTDIGIDDDFMRELGATLEPGSSALFLLVVRATPDRVLDELAPFGGTILRTSLSHADERALRDALSRHHATAPASPTPAGAPAPNVTPARG